MALAIKGNIVASSDCSQRKMEREGMSDCLSKGKKGRGRKETKRQAILKNREKHARREKKD